MKVLIAPLNWGLGHATRCIPLIKNYLEQNNELIIASDGIALQLLKNEFPNLQFYELPSYDINYKNNNLVWGMFIQSFKIINAVWSENKAVARIANEHKLDLIISDNRLGCFNQKIKSIYITHQLNLPIENRLVRFFGNLTHHYFIKKYAECWIPDFETLERSISGALSHPVPKTLTQKTKFIGTLSRFTYLETKKIFSLIVVLSGPEPQRTQFENILIDQINQHWEVLTEADKFKICFVRGSHIENERLIFNFPTVEIHDLIATETLNQKILQSNFYCGRSGYTTLMDVLSLKIPTILVPTPRQFEQVYLANFHRYSLQFISTLQENFNLRDAYESIKAKTIVQ